MARASAAAWRAAVESGTQQALGQATGYLHHAASALFGNPGMAQLARTLSSGARAPVSPAETLAMRDPNAFIQQGLEQFAARLGQQALRQEMSAFSTKKEPPFFFRLPAQPGCCRHTKPQRPVCRLAG